MKKIYNIKNSKGQIITSSLDVINYNETSLFEEISKFNKLELNSLVKTKFNNFLGKTAIHFNNKLKELSLEGYEVKIKKYDCGKIYPVFYTNNEEILTATREDITFSIVSSKNSKINILDETKIDIYLKTNLENNIINKEQYEYLIKSVYFMLNYVFNNESYLFWSLAGISVKEPYEFVKKYLFEVPLEEMNIPKDIFKKMTKENYSSLVYDNKENNYFKLMTDKSNIDTFFDLPCGIFTQYNKITENGFLLEYSFDKEQYIENYKTKQKIITLDLINILSIMQSEWQKCFEYSIHK